MDAKRYDHFADKIMQLKNALPQEWNQDDPLVKQYLHELQKSLSNALVLMDTVAKMDDQGWVK